MNLSDEIVRWAGELSAQSNAAYDLWTWLPSYRVATTHHGDRASAFRPPISEVMSEAAMYFAHMKAKGGALATAAGGVAVGEIDSLALTDEEKEWFQRCPCGEVPTVIVKGRAEP